MHLLEQLVLKYPDDIEAKAFFALDQMGGEHRYCAELILQQVLARDPNHPGAHRAASATQGRVAGAAAQLPTHDACATWAECLGAI